jgi:hypothetical protein
MPSPADEPALRAAIDRERHQLRADAAVVQQRVALGRCPIADHPFAGAVRLDEECQDVALRVHHLPAEAAVRIQPIEPGLELAREHVSHRR